MELTQEDVREVIVNVAREIFARFGFKKTTMDEIAHAAHKAKSSIYHYFKSKEEIFQAIAEKEGRLFRRELIETVNKEDTPQKKLRAYFITRMHNFRNLINFYSVLKGEYLEHHNFIKKLREKYDKEEIEMISKILREGVKQKIFVIKDIDVTSLAIITALKGFEYPWMTEENSRKIEQNIDSLFDILFNGIVKK